MTGDGSCLERMCEVIGAGEDDLVRRVVTAARDHRLERVPPNERAWRESILGLSDAIFQAAYGIYDGYAEGLAHTDPIIAYGVVRARTHRARGTDLHSWEQLLRHYRLAYLDLLETAGFDGEELLVCHRFLNRVFDRFEEGFRQGFGAGLDGGRPDAIPA